MTVLNLLPLPPQPPPTAPLSPTSWTLPCSMPTFFRFSSNLALASSISVRRFWKLTSTVSHCSRMSRDVSSSTLSTSVRSWMEAMRSCSARAMLSWENWAQDSGVLWLQGGKKATDDQILCNKPECSEYILCDAPLLLHSHFHWGINAQF